MNEHFLNALRACCKDEASFQKALRLVETEFSKKAELEETMQHTIATLQGEVRERLDILARYQEKEMLFRAVFDNAALGIAYTMLTDSDYTITNANQAFCEMLGYTVEELQSLSVSKISHPEDFDAQMILTRQLERGEISKYVFIKRYIRKDGSIFWGRIHASVFRDANGQLIFTSVVRDITLEKEAGENLKQSERQLHWLLNALPFAIALYKDKEMIFTNRAFLESRGLLSFEDALRAKFLSKSDESYALIHPEDCAQFMGNFESHRERIEAGETLEFERRIRKLHSNEYNWFQGYLFKGDYIDGTKVVVEVDAPIHARKQAELALLESENRYRQVVETQSDFVLISEPDTTVTFVNESLRRALGLTLEQIIGLKWIDFADRNDIAGIEQKILALSPFNQTFLNENRDRRAGGEIGLTQWLNQGIFDAQGRLIKIQSVGRDITAIKNAEFALRENQTKLNAYFNSTVESIFLIAPDFKILEFNAVARNIVKQIYERDIQIGDSMLDYAEASTKPAFIEHFRQALKGEKIELEIEIPYPSGRIWWEVKYLPVFDDDRRIVGVAFITENITKRKEAEERLRKNEAMLSETERIAQIGSWEYDIATGKIIWSAEVFRIFSRDFSLGEPNYEEINAALVENDATKLQDATTNAIQFGEDYELTMQLNTIPAPKYVHIIGKVHLGSDGKAKKLYGTIQDVTKEIEAKAERDAIYAQLLQSQKMESLGMLASGVAHEFNNILAGIMGSANLLRKEFAPESKPAKRIFQIEESSRRAATIIKQMLGFARQGKTDLKRFPISQCVEEVVQMIEPTLDKRIQVVIQMEPNLPAIEGDKGQLDQVILNLAVNARDAMMTVLEQGRENCILKFESNYARIPEHFSAQYDLATETTFVHLIVSDTGTGIPESIQEKIFEPFFTTKEVGKGTGLGLAMVYGIVKNHNGYILLKARSASGRHFTSFCRDLKRRWRRLQKRKQTERKQQRTGALCSLMMNSKCGS